MPIVKQKKVMLYALKQDRDSIMEALQRYGKMHIESAIDEAEEQNSRNATEISKEYDLIEWAIRELKQFDERKKAMLAPKDTVDYSALEKLYDNREPLIEAAGSLRALEDERIQQSSKRIRLDNVIENISPWLGLDIPVETITDSDDCVISAGVVPSAEFEGFMEDIDKIDGVHVEKIVTDKESTYVFMVYHLTVSEHMIPLLSRVGYSPANFGGYEGTPREIIAGVEREISKLDVKEKEIVAQKQTFAKNLDAFEELLDALMITKGRREKSEGTSETEYVFTLEGYIPTHLEEELRKVIKKAAGDRAQLDITEPTEDDNVPTLIENRALVAPFQSVTDMFGIIDNKSVEPNAVMAPFYVMFFGIMLSDAGYGVILAVVASLVYKLTSTKGKKKSGNKLVGVIAMGGVFTAIWGLLFGGFMGFEVKPLWFNPMQEPLMMLGLCFGFGIIHLVAGLFMRAVILIKRKQYMAAIAEQFTWILLLLGTLLFSGAMIGNLTGGEITSIVEMIGSIGKYCALAGVASIIILGGYNKKGIGKIFGGISSLYGITGYLSDILSYSRLFALGLATGVIGMVIKVMVDLIWGAPWIGPIIASVVFVGGHIFNIAINTLGAYVHSSRLQYIEFFGKFFESGGKLFDPFAIKTKYHNIKDEF